MNVACSGLAPNAKKEEWLKLANGDERLRIGMSRLHYYLDARDALLKALAV